MTKSQMKFVAESYAIYFGRAADADTIKEYGLKENGKAEEKSVILENIIADADVEIGQIDPADFVNNAFQNLFGRNATTKEMSKYYKVVDAGKDLPIQSIVKSATKTDKAVYNNKMAVAVKYAELGGKGDLDLSKISKGNLIDIKFVNTVTKAADLKAKVDALADKSGIPSSFDGKPFVLTASADTGSKFVGTEKGDVFKADSFFNADGKYYPTLNSNDELDGGAGKDTLNITDETTAYTMATATIKNIETITIKGAAAVTADVSGSNVTGLETISVTKATDATVTAAATTAVNVSGISAGVYSNDTDISNDNPATVTVTGGSTQTVNVANKGIAVTLTKAAGAINVTSSNNETLGAADVNDTPSLSDITTTHGTDVTVTATLANDTATAKTAGDITIGDGINNQSGNVVVTQNLTSNSKQNLNGGEIKVNGGKTVNVTVNSTTTAKDATAGNDIINGDVTVNSDGKTTSVTVKQNSTVTKFVTPATDATAATQTVTFKALAATENITLVGAAGQSLTFTASKALTAAEVAAAFANLTDGDIQANGGKTANGIYTSTNGGLKAGFTTGAVTSIDADNASVTFSTTTDSNAGTPAVIEGQVITTTGSTASKVSVAPEVVGKAAVPEAKTGNTVTYGDIIVDEKAAVAASITTVTLDGFKDADLGGNTALNALTTLSIANSAGTTTLKTTKTALTLNVDNITNAVDLDDSAAAITTLTINANGEDSDFNLTATKVETLTIAAAADLDLDNTSTLSALKTVTITGAGDVTLGDVSATLETLTASAATGAISATVDGDKATVTTGSGNDVITVDTATVTKAITLGAGNDRLDLSTIATVNATTTAAIAGGAGTDTVVLDADLADVTSGLSSLANSAIFKSKVTGFEKLEIAGASTSARDVNVGNLGYNHVILGANTTALTLSDMANNGTVVLTAAQAAGATVAVKDAAAGLTDVLNVVLNVANDVNNGTLTVANVETIKITATDSTPIDDNELSPTFGDATINESTLALVATSAKTVTITGNAHLDLDMTLNTAATLIDGSTMTGDLKVTAYNSGMTVKGGSGDDTLSVSGSPVAATLTGGKGTDTFDVSAFDANGNPGSAVTITDLTAGETIVFSGTGAEKFVSSKITLISEATFTEYVAEAAKVANAASTGAEDNIAWFQYNNNTFAVQDMNSDGTFNTGDIIVKINGVKDLSTASFNATIGTLEIA